MAAHPIVVVDHGKIIIPNELHDDPRFRDGARLQLVPVEVNATGVEHSAEAWETFMGLQGLLADSEYDPNAELEKEKQRELEEEAPWARS